MPRIDPTRLLLCLKSLLNLQTGGIKSDKDVDKVFVLMTKFSKKLVSKCTYINILKATAPDVLNVFMDRGGWEMLHNWTVEAKNAKNHDLLDEILTLLIITPASVDRLRANSLPKEVKQISNKWDVANTKALAEKLVSKWITIARSEDSGAQQSQQQQLGAAQSSVNLNSNLASTAFGMQNMVQLSGTNEAGLNSNNLADSAAFESEGQSNPIDLDDHYINNVDLNEMMDFNPELFTKTIDQCWDDEADRNQLMQATSSSSSNNVDVNVSAASDIILQQQVPFTQPANPSVSVINRPPDQPTVTTATTTMPVVSSSPAIPRIVIKTSGGQRSVVIQQQGNPQIAAPTQPADNVNKERVCFVTRNGQRFLMQLQVADNETVDKLNLLSVMTGSSNGIMTAPASIVHQQLPPVAVPQLTQDQQVTSSVASVSPEASSSTTSTPSPAPDQVQSKRKRPRKDPTITAMKKLGANTAKPDSFVAPPKVLKTYSKKVSAVMLADAQAQSMAATAVAPTPTQSSDANPSKASVAAAVSNVPPKPIAPTTTTTVVATPAKTSNSKPTSQSASGTPSSSTKQSSSAKRASKQSSAAAAAAAAEAEKAEKLKQKTKEAKKKMKERLNDKNTEKKKSEDDKQKQKDDQTLKAIYGASAPQTTKIPKKPKPSFTDLIGVPGAKEEPKKEKITKEKNDKSGKSGKDKDTDANNSNSDNKDEEPTDVTGLGEFARPDSKELGPSTTKERRHQVKVYVSAKSKNMDLLETMTKGSSSKAKSKVVDGDGQTEGKTEKSSSSGGVSFEDAISGASSSSSRTATKRPSIDSTTKTGDSKKLKLDDAISDSKKDSKAAKDKKAKEEKKAKESVAVKKAQVIQESSLFMDTLNATREPAKTKRRRRISSSDSKEKDSNSTLSTNNTLSSIHTSPAQELPSATPNQDIVKPVINFYRDTLNDSDDDGANAVSSADSNKIESETLTNVNAATNSTNDGDKDNKLDDVVDIADDFAPEEWEGKLKSCLCIHRPKGRAKKLVRWREEDELKEFHFFEMDETERVNVTKEIKNFTEMKQQERSEEHKINSGWKQTEFGVGNQPEERYPWFTPKPIEFPEGTIKHDVNSREQQVQDERERSILQVFYFPGATLPDHPSEVDVVNMEIDSNNIPTMIPADDVPVLTKMYDQRGKLWPRPKFGISVGNISTAKSSSNHAMQPSSIIQHTVPNQTPILDPTHAFSNVFNSTAQQVVGAGVGNVDAFNPWVHTFNQAATQQVNNDPWKVVQEQVSSFPPFPTAANVPPVNAFPQLQAFGFPSFANPPPMGTITMPPMQQQQQPRMVQPPSLPVPGNYGPFGIPTPQQFDPTQNPVGREDSGPPRHHPPGGRGSRDVDYRDMRRNDRERDRDDRDTRNRDREHPRAGRGGDRGRDRDFRDRGRDRGDRSDRDYRSHDRDRGAYKRSSGGRRGTPCNYFAKGFCREGNKCSFLHPGVNGPPLDNSVANNGSNSRKPSSPPSSGTYYENSRRRSPPLSNKDLPTNFQGSPTNTSSSMDSSSHSSRSRDIPEIESPTPETETRFDMPPSSPSENHSFPPRAEPVKVIPTFTEEDWG